jgi:hypothetical protein
VQEAFQHAAQELRGALQAAAEAAEEQQPSSGRAASGAFPLLQTCFAADRAVQRPGRAGSISRQPAAAEDYVQLAAAGAKRRRG